MISSLNELKHLRGLDSGEKLDPRDKIRHTAARVGLSVPKVWLTDWLTDPSSLLYAAWWWCMLHGDDNDVCHMVMIMYATWWWWWDVWRNSIINVNGVVSATDCGHVGMYVSMHITYHSMMFMCRSYSLRMSSIERRTKQFRLSADSCNYPPTWDRWLGG